MLEKKPDERPDSARDVVERLGLFRSATSRSAPRSKRKASVAPASGGDTKPSAREIAVTKGPAKLASSSSSSSASDKKAPLPRTDTIAIVEANASKPKEVPTWLALAAIVLLSLVAGMTTYLVRMRTSADPPAASTTTSAGPKALASGK